MIREHRSRSKLEAYYQNYTEKGVLDPNVHPWVAKSWAKSASLRVDYEPAGADVLLNGKKVGMTPLEIKELAVGDYQLEIWKEYYVKEFASVKIAEDQEWKESTLYMHQACQYPNQLQRLGDPG